MDMNGAPILIPAKHEEVKEDIRRGERTREINLISLTPIIQQLHSLFLDISPIPLVLGVGEINADPGRKSADLSDN